ncbi:hypothetical protein EC968_005574 [Mortierella alpina]|nr:hypothetical protein EC968_005574 [Mortierella alpina]
MSYSNSKTQLTTDDVDNSANGFAPNDAHDYDALLRGAGVAPVAHDSTTNDNDVNGISFNPNSSSIHNGMASSSSATTTPTSMTANSANQRLRTSTSYMGAASGTGSSSGETTTSSISPSAGAASAALPLTMTIGGSSGVSEVKLKRFLEHNQRLREQLDMRRIKVSEASQR